MKTKNMKSTFIKKWVRTLFFFNNCMLFLFISQLVMDFSLLNNPVFTSQLLFVTVQGAGSKEGAGWSAQ